MLAQACICVRLKAYVKREMRNAVQACLSSSNLALQDFVHTYWFTSHCAGFKVCVVDPEPLAAWPNNYGVWVDEFKALGLDDCLEHIWPQAKVFLDNTPEGAK